MESFWFVMCLVLTLVIVMGRGAFLALIKEITRLRIVLSGIRVELNQKHEPVPLPVLPPPLPIPPPFRFPVPPPFPTSLLLESTTGGAMDFLIDEEPEPELTYGVTPPDWVKPGMTAEEMVVARKFLLSKRKSLRKVGTKRKKKPVAKKPNKRKKKS